MAAARNNKTKMPPIISRASIGQFSCDPRKQMPDSRLRSVAPMVSPNGACAASSDSSHRWNQWQAPVLGPSVQPQMVGVPTNGANMKSKLLVSTMLLALLALPVAAQAQGTVRGAERGAAHSALR